jgi:hypothetical protein
MAILAAALVLSWPADGEAMAAGRGGALIVAACICWGIDNNLTRQLSAADPVQIAMVKGVAAAVMNTALGFAHGAQLPEEGTFAAAAIVGFLGYGVSRRSSYWGRLYRKGPGQPAKLAYLGHVLMENRHALVVDTRLTLATGTAEREAALEMVAQRPGNHRITLGADKAYDVAEFVADPRQYNVTPHVAQNTTNRRSAIDGRTTRHLGYVVSGRVRKRRRCLAGPRRPPGFARPVTAALPRQADPRGRDDVGECRRQHGNTRSVAWARDPHESGQAYRGQRAVIREHAPRGQSPLPSPAGLWMRSNGRKTASSRKCGQG